MRPVDADKCHLTQAGEGGGVGGGLVVDFFADYAYSSCSIVYQCIQPCPYAGKGRLRIHESTCSER